MPRLFVRGSDGVVCIHTGADNVVNAPTADLSRVLFHSSLEYPALIRTQTATVTLKGRLTNTVARTTHTLFAHGQAGTPFVLGYIANLGNVSLAGTVPIEVYSGGFGRFVTLGADATNVLLHENTTIPNTLPGGALNTADVSLSMVIFVTDLLL